jgi:L-alanine-DL-glutamate epimerase-like enolase superfamily enzyme
MRAQSSTLPVVPIQELHVSVYRIPTDFPESDGTFEWDSTTIVIVEIEAGDAKGIGFTYSDVAAATLIHGRFAELLSGSNAFDIESCWSVMVRNVRNIGRQGIAASAISAVDNALWDLKAKLLDVPLVKLLGQVRDDVAVYGSGGFTSYSIAQIEQQFGQWAAEGIRAFKMKVGRDPQQDPHRVAAAHRAIGPDSELFVDANGAYDRRQAMAMAPLFASSGVTWFEEPVSSDDLEGLRFIRQHTPAAMRIAAGEYGYDQYYFRQMLAAEAVDVLMPDATRCLGITGFLKAAALADAFFVPVSSHCAPSMHLHVGCATRRLLHLEYFHDHSRIESMLFDGCVLPIDGILRPDLSRAGHGIALRRSDADRFEVR